MRQALASPRTVIALAVLMCGAYATLLLPKPEVDWFTFEDGVWETMGAVAVFAASVITVLVWRRSRGRGRKVYRIVLLGLALLLFLVGGEEIAWGQHLFHWPTPGGFARHNQQNETTLHNVREVGGGKGFVFNVFWFSFGVVVPLVAAINDRARRFLRTYLPVLPLWLAGLFLLNHAASKGVRVAIPSSLYHGTHFLGRSAVEIKEAWVETCFFFAVAWLYWGEPGEPPFIKRVLRVIHRKGGRPEAGDPQGPREPAGRG